MKTYRIAVIGGDGVGPEVTVEAQKVLDAVAARDEFRLEFTEFPWGSSHYRRHGDMMPANGLEQLRRFDAILFGAVGDPEIAHHITLHGLILPIRRGFDQGVCLRPAYLYEGIASPLAGKQPGDIDIVVFRENAEGEYALIGGSVYSGSPYEVATQTSVFTRRGTERIIRAAFEYACQRRERRKVTSITKSNAQAFSMVFWDTVFREVAAQYPDIQTETLLVDRACMDLIRCPESFDVVVASNLFGDIITDITAIITGSLGLAASANLNPERQHPSMFEPVHGAAFDIVGQGIANPLAAILAGAMLLEWLGEGKAARRIQDAVRLSLKENKVRSPDLGGASETAEVGAEVARLVS